MTSEVISCEGGSMLDRSVIRDLLTRHADHRGATVRGEGKGRIRTGHTMGSIGNWGVAAWYRASECDSAEMRWRNEGIEAVAYRDCLIGS